jgi:rare lipoprotein A
MLPWERPYAVDGKRYVPLLNAEGYREEGLASWYGEEEHGKPTSNGEIFDMYKMTAAHKILPLGSYVKVTNKSNGRQTTVRVNDRGPFIADRVLDLSYQAAKELGILDCGVIPVSIEVLSSSPASPATGNTPITGKIYTLQVAAFSDREAASSLSETLRKEFDYSFIQPVQTEKGFFYRVHAGRFKSREDAEAAKTSLAGKGFPDAFIVSRQ